LTITYTEDGEIKTYIVGEHNAISLPQNKTPTHEQPKDVPEQPKKETKNPKKVYPKGPHNS